MIRNVGAQNNGTIINDMRKNDVQNAQQNIEKQEIEKQSRVDELKKQIANGE